MSTMRVSPRPLAPRRHDEILKRLAADGSVGVSELAEFFGVSRETIRRDLKQLADRGRLDIVHGGAARRESLEPALDQRASENAEGKAAIGRAAAALVEDGMVLLFDSGTTTLAVAHALGGHRNLTICTGSLAIAQLACRMPDTRVHLLGGEVDPNEEATVGVDTLEAIGRFRVDLAFVGGGGLSPDGEVTDYTRAGAEQRSRMIAAAGRAYFVVDRSKFGLLTPLRIPHFEAAAGVIVDTAPPAAIGEALARKGPRLIVARGA
ncbi:DeoR/GlpR family DNA-binding transcription regulator [Chelatococcus sp. SYSU_G07232]|uniref:DeoR/GlpR family DNA-binding transcription regulator n=1 Tax=Chelatococcus albus TaxID=3047466 RepID=A0ABT7AL16_9HYPH|nr:DeoR/GlpR family DNA-binding transcription regulator [Chelatococcus sp. SYSU_G07232]MDJ1160067.1 DeoR/GlpR family DNA-binding transcription regulator [Chelatococcus sp. SYSU_G07232]